MLVFGEKIREKMSLWAKGENKEVIEIISEQLSEICQDDNQHPGFILLLPLSLGAVPDKQLID